MAIKLKYPDSVHATTSANVTFVEYRVDGDNSKVVLSLSAGLNMSFDVVEGVEELKALATNTKMILTADGILEATPDKVTAPGKRATTSGCMPGEKREFSI